MDQGDGSPSSRKAGRRIAAASLNVAGRFRRAASQGGAAGRRRRVRRRKVGRRKAGQTLDLPSRFALIPCGRETPREREKAEEKKKEARVFKKIKPSDGTDTCIVVI